MDKMFIDGELYVNENNKHPHHSCVLGDRISLVFLFFFKTTKNLHIFYVLFNNYFLFNYTLL